MLKATHHLSPENALLGEVGIVCDLFESLDDILVGFMSPHFKEKSTLAKFFFVSEALLNLILNAPQEAFLLSAVLNYIERVNQCCCLDKPYSLNAFEFWLNHFSKIDRQMQLQLRGKIAGKWINRDDYQLFFPIGMGKTFSGSHFVTAHQSPDADTTVASFWGWLDAFAAKISEGQHLWSLPGGAPKSHVTMLLTDFFGSSCFSLANTSGALTLTAMDLLSQQQVYKAQPNTLMSTLDHSIPDTAIILVDSEGRFLGDWRSADAEIVGQIMLLFQACLRWFETHLYNRLMGLFSKPTLCREDISIFLSELLNIKIKDCETVRLFTDGQRKYLDDFLFKILDLQIGLQSSFNLLNDALEKHSQEEVLHFGKNLNKLQTAPLFDAQGQLNASRSEIFCVLQKTMKEMDHSMQNIRLYLDQLGMGMRVKTEVLGSHLHYVDLASDVEEIRSKIANRDYLTVVLPVKDRALFPLGVVRTSQLQRKVLGTATLRDFCNQQEIKLASYLEVISVIDHHKSTLTTFSTPSALIGDVQSCNVLIAEQCFKINERYSIGGMTALDIEKEKQRLVTPPTSSIRKLNRVLQKQMALEKKESFFIHPDREFAEYLCFLLAILDDTDLLMKVSSRDLECVATLLNKLKSLVLKQEVEIVNLELFPRNDQFISKARHHILHQKDMYSIYKKIYNYKEKEVETHLKSCLAGEASHFFDDTKEQNGCCRVGQTKLFSSNFSLYAHHADKLKALWIKNAQKVFSQNEEIDLHLHMISTISNADEVYAGNRFQENHQDELWIWIPSTLQSQRHLIAFLNAFQNAPEILNNQMQLEFSGADAEELTLIFQRNFNPTPYRILEKKNVPLAVLKVNAGSLNSRKSMITPYLPHLIS